MLDIRHLTKRYGDERAVEELSLSVAEGEFLTILGPSGSGKSTTLLAIAGHVAATSGAIALDGEDLTHTPPEKRSLGVVFQQDALFEHMTARENIAYALGPHDGEWDDEERVDRFLSLVGMAGHAGKYPDQLSGGQRRRIELARALVYEPDVLLLDEPLTGLDRTLREEMRGEISRIHDETDVTTVYVTHDQTEALTLSDRIAVLDGGELAAVGTPRRLYERPPNRFVATFLGSLSTFPGTVVDTDPLVVEWAGHRFELAAATAAAVGDRFRLYCRPEAVAVGGSAAITVDGEAIDLTHSGDRSTIAVRTADGGQFEVPVGGFPAVEAGDQLTLGIDPGGVFGFVGERRCPARACGAVPMHRSEP